MRTKALSAIVAFGLVACGDSEPAPQAAPPAAEAPAAAAPAAAPATLTTPEWFQIDRAARTVSITLTAGASTANNSWNFNGHFNGTGGITVPAGYTVTLTLVNRDQAMAHSMGVSAVQATYPAQFTEVVPAFAGAVTANPTSMTESTLPGETESVTFVADQAGNYVIVCYVTGHAATGMWVPFTVGTGDDAGVLQ